MDWEERYQTLFEEAPVMYVITRNQDGRPVITDCNQLFLDTLGYTRAEVLERPLADFYTPESRAQLLEGGGYRQALAGHLIDQKRELVSREGRIVKTLLRALPDTDADGHVSGTRAMYVDITARRQAEEALRESEARFRALTETTIDGIVIIDPQCTIVFANQAVKGILGYSTEEIVGQSLDIVIPHQLRSRYRAFLKKYLAGGGPDLARDVVELTGLHKSGQEVLLEASLGEFSGRDQRFFFGIFRNITKRKRAEEAFHKAHEELEMRVHERTVELSASNALLKKQSLERRKAEEKFRILLEAAPDAIVIVNQAGEITLVNEQAEKLFGYPRQMLLGQPIELLVPERYRTKHVQQRLDYVANPRSRFIDIGLELSGLRRDGSEFPAEVSLNPLKTEEGVLVLSAIRDVTERKRVEEEIRTLNTELERRVAERTAQLEAANEELEAFVYSISHDLRAPLRAINGFSHILMEDYAAELPPEARRYLNLVGDHAAQMDQLVDDLLTLSRLGRQALKKQPVALAELVRQVLAGLVNEQEQRRVEITVGELPPCQADPTLLRQALVNLLSNALKYTRRREVARIEIGCREMDGRPVYFVKDNGVGFDMRYADRLFSVFQRLHRAEEYEGSGVGLVIVQRVIQRHGGRVWAEGEIDKGATFYFNI